LGVKVFLRRAIFFGVILGAGLALFAIVAWYSTAAFQATGASGESWNGMMGGMWGGMMGNNNYNYYNGGYPDNLVLHYSWIGTLAALGLCILGTAGLVYYIAYPQISYAQVATAPSSSPTGSPTQSPSVAIVSHQQASASPTSGPIQEGRDETVSSPTETFQPTARYALRDGKVQDDRQVEEEETLPKALSWSVLLRTLKPDERKVLEVLAAHDGTYLQKYVSKESGLSKLRTHRIVARFVERGIVTASKSGNTNEVSLADWLKKPEPKQ
jgi:hypothetical protein